MERNFTGKTIDDAIKAASEELGLAREDFSVDVIENRKAAFSVSEQARSYKSYLQKRSKRR